MEDPMSYTNILRMNAEKFEELLSLIHDKVQKRDSVMRNAIPISLIIWSELQRDIFSNNFKTIHIQNHNTS